MVDSALDERDADMARWNPERYPDTVVTDEKGPNGYPTALIYRDDFQRLQEYSCTVPTGVYVGKRWKCNLNVYAPAEPNWIMGAYETAAHDPSMCALRWYDVMLVDRSPATQDKKRASR